jgi:hypothetical protein
MAIDLAAETERQRAAEAAAAKLQAARERLLSMAEPSALGASKPLTAPQVAPAMFSGSVTPQEMIDQVRLKSGHAFTMNAPFHNFFRAWPVLGRRSVLAVVREAFLLINGREPTLDECESYLRGAVEARLNSGELRYLIAVNAGIASPKNTLSKRQLLLKVLGTLARRTIGKRGVPYRFSAIELAFDSFVLDAMRLTTSLMSGTGAPNSGSRT